MVNLGYDFRGLPFCFKGFWSVMLYISLQEKECKQEHHLNIRNAWMCLRKVISYMQISAQE
jgi:hypothetical protein